MIIGAGYSMRGWYGASSPISSSWIYIISPGRQRNVTAAIRQGTGLMAEKSGCWIMRGVETEQELHFALECGARIRTGHLFRPVRRRIFCQ